MSPVLTPAVGAAGSVGDLGWQVLGPRAGTADEVAAEDESGRQNDASLVVMTVAGVRVLLSGDVERPGHEAIVAAGSDLHVDVLKVPHHGSSRQDQAFLAATHARLAIVSAGVDNDYGHPAPGRRPASGPSACRCWRPASTAGWLSRSAAIV